MVRLVKFVFLFLNLGTFLMFSKCDETVPSEENTENTDGTESPEPKDDKHVLTMEQCMNAINSTSFEDICCNKTVEHDKLFKICSVIEDNRPTETLLIRHSRIIECIYKRKKYIKSDTQLNMGSIKADAKKLYHNDDVQKNFMVDMYRDCGRRATKVMGSIDERIFTVTHKPFFMFVYACVVNYINTKCPYFSWKGQNELDMKTCSDVAAQCKELYKEI